MHRMHSTTPCIKITTTAIRHVQFHIEYIIDINAIIKSIPRITNTTCINL